MCNHLHGALGMYEIITYSTGFSPAPAAGTVYNILPPSSMTRVKRFTTFFPLNNVMFLLTKLMHRNGVKCNAGNVGNSPSFRSPPTSRHLRRRVSNVAISVVCLWCKQLHDYLLCLLKFRFINLQLIGDEGVSAFFL